MLSKPKIIKREPTPYIGICERMPMNGIKPFVDRSFRQIFTFLEQSGATPTGAAFLKYNVIDMARELEIEAGVPIESPVEGEGDIFCGELPAGRFGHLTHTGPFTGLMDATRHLLDWAKSEGLEWDMHTAEDGDHFACRLEIYETDPSEEPDSSKWVTKLQFKLVDGPEQ